MTTESTNGTGSSGLWQLLKERRTRAALYGLPGYWDSRASARTGMARSLWPSNVYNALWDERQRLLLDRLLGDVRGRRIVDIGCGTGRMTRWLAEQRGAGHVTGLDFSEATVEAARHESGALVSSGVVSFEQADILQAQPPPVARSFDDAVVLGVLSVACADRAALSRGLANIARMVRRGGRVLAVEPIHRSPVLHRLLRLGTEDWIACANEVGLSLVAADRMGFLPVRALFSVRDFPRPLVAAAFGGGERLLDRAPWLSPLSDYKLLLFKRTGS